MKVDIKNYEWGNQWTYFDDKISEAFIGLNDDEEEKKKILIECIII